MVDGLVRLLSARLASVSRPTRGEERFEEVCGNVLSSSLYLALSRERERERERAAPVSVTFGVQVQVLILENNQTTNLWCRLYYNFGFVCFLPPN
jgi:hypothetical protein